MNTRILSRGMLISACFLILTALTPAVMADGLAQITRAFSGIWDQPRHQSQGFILEITEDGEGQKIGVAYWFTYGDDLFSSWFLAVGPVEGDQINMTLYEASGIAFLGGSLEGDPNVEEIGTLVMTFSNCQHGNASWETGDHPLGSGDVEIKRLTRIYRMECSGGISDDTPSDAKPNRLKAYLIPARDDVFGEGEALFWERTDRSDFKVEVEGVPDETYTLEVCDEVRGEIVVLAGEGEIKFRSPGIDGMPLLDFDPRDCPIEVLDGLGVALTTGDQVLSVNPADPDDDEEETETEIEVELTNTGVLGGAEGEAEYE
ncbi:MAG: hypothetical protein GWM87_14990, partial [Xanthomonadales bacterium]|nr:hypothetical protein [Xanthomonadales bacterium]NIX14096.1 hypothetical protein [Xanthomonadales bacterium]